MPCASQYIIQALSLWKGLLFFLSVIPDLKVNFVTVEKKDLYFSVISKKNRC